LYNLDLLIFLLFFYFPFWYYLLIDSCFTFILDFYLYVYNNRQVFCYFIFFCYYVQFFYSSFLISLDHYVLSCFVVFIFYFPFCVYSFIFSPFLLVSIIHSCTILLINLLNLVNSLFFTRCHTLFILGLYYFKFFILVLLHYYTRLFYLGHSFILVLVRFLVFILYSY